MILCQFEAPILRRREWRLATSGRTFTFTSRSAANCYAKVAAGGAETLESRYKPRERRFRWSQTTPSERARLFLKVEDRQRADGIAEVLVANQAHDLLCDLSKDRRYPPTAAVGILP